ncbi:MAG: ABC transporter substrate-binding protein [Actinomycetota bacterium]|nr:ABC transporter substrate-binding protein [Actinomycetota bacterium]
MRRRSCTLVALFLLTLTCGGENGRDGVAISDRSGPGLSDTEIRLGILSDESGPRKAIGLPRVEAARVFFQALNELGGIKGRRVRLVVADHQFNPEVATEKYREMKDSVLMIEQIYPLAFLRDDLARDGVLASPVARFSSLAGDRHLMMTGTPYRIEMSNAVDWLASTLADPQRTTIAAVTQADDYGADGLAGIKEAARSHGLQLGTTLTYQPTDVDFSAQVAALKASGAEYVFMTTTSRVTAKIIEGCAGVGFAPSFMGSYFSFHPQIIADNPALKPLFAASLKTSGPFARWGEDVPGMKAMLDAISRYAPEQKPDPFFLHGWIQAGIVAEVLKQAAEMDNLTRPGVLKALESMPAVKLGGLSPSLSYGREAGGRPPSQQTRMFDISVDDPRYPDMLKPITEFYVGETAVAR